VQVPFVDGAELARRLPIRDAIDALEAAFRDGDPSATPLRSHVTTPEGALLLMPAVGEAGVGVKLVTLTEANPDRGLPLIHALYALFDPLTQTPRMLVDGSALAEGGVHQDLSKLRDGERRLALDLDRSVHGVGALRIHPVGARVH